MTATPLLEDDPTVPEEDWSPEVEELEVLLLLDVLEVDELDAVEVVASELPGIVAAATAASTPTPAIAPAATPAVRRFIRRCAASRAWMRPRTSALVMNAGCPRRLKRLCEDTWNSLRKTAGQPPRFLSSRPRFRSAVSFPAYAPEKIHRQGERDMVMFRKPLAAAAIAGSMLVGGVAGAVLYAATTISAAAASNNSNAAAVAAAATPSPGAASGKFVPNENAAHEAGESAAREAQENAGQVPTVP